MAYEVSGNFVERTFDTRELTINCAEGPASGPPVVMLHGSTGNWQGYLELMARLSPRWHVFACDLRGHGKSGRTGDRYCLTDYVQDIVAFVRAQSEPAVVLGHSLGAMIALAVGAEAPERTRALVLLDPGLFARSPAVDYSPKAAEIFEYLAWVRDLMRSQPTLSEIEAACRRRPPYAAEAEIDDLVERVSHVAPESVDAVLRGQLGEGVDLGEIARKVAQPTLLLHGDWAAGAAVREEDVEWLRALIPSLRVVRIPGGSHLFLWEQPEMTMSAIEDFLSTLT